MVILFQLGTGNLMLDEFTNACMITLMKYIGVCCKVEIQGREKTMHQLPKYFDETIRKSCITSTLRKIRNIA
jgi:hypothetical protein